jgi:hypothetical protein
MLIANCEAMKKIIAVFLASATILSGNVVKAGTCSFDNLASCVLTEGNTTISNVSITSGGVLPFQLTGTLNFSTSSSTWIVQTSFNPSETSASSSTYPGLLSYTLTINEPAKTFNRYTINNDINTLTAGGTSQTVNATGAPQIIKVDSSTPVPNPGTFSGINTSINVTSSWFTNDPATFNTLSQTFSQRDIPPVPSPLTLLGAGAAFGFSRRLRNRIKQVE